MHPYQDQPLTSMHASYAEVTWIKNAVVQGGMLDGPTVQQSQRMTYTQTGDLPCEVQAPSASVYADDHRSVTHYGWLCLRRVRGTADHLVPSCAICRSILAE